MISGIRNKTQGGWAPGRRIAFRAGGACVAVLCLVFLAGAGIVCGTGVWAGRVSGHRRDLQPRRGRLRRGHGGAETGG